MLYKWGPTILSERKEGALGQSLLSLCGAGHPGQLTLLSVDALGFPTLESRAIGRCVFSFSRHCKLVFLSEVPPLRMVENCQQQWERLCFDFARLRGRWLSMPLNSGEALLSHLLSDLTGTPR